jgi:hypothetical protein
MTRNQALVIFLVYLIGAAASIAWAMDIQNMPLWSAAGVLGLVLWTSFFGFCNAIGWMAYWSREHWLG